MRPPCCCTTVQALVSGSPNSGKSFAAAPPTASSAYILTVQMGGDDRFGASLITLNVLMAVVTLPIRLSALPLG